MDYKTSGVGSLPFTDIDQAVHYALGFDIPYLAQLPLVSANELMLKQSIDGLNKQSEELGFEFVTWDATLLQLQQHQCDLFKMQYCGAYCLKYYGQCPETTEQLASQLATRLSAYIHYFRQLNQQILIVLDEPQVDDPVLFKQAYDLLFSYLPPENHSSIGIHCCGKVDWDIVLHYPFAAISFDAEKHLAALSKHSKINQLKQTKCMLFIGAIPTDWESWQGHSCNQLTQQIHALTFPANNIVITPACGHAYRSTTAASFAKLASFELAQALRQS